MSNNTNCSHCADYSRSQVLSQGIAQAGRGLPQVEIGMPAPAGSGLSRRAFLTKSAGLSLTVFGAAALGPRVFELGIANAAAASPSNPILVSIWLSGGLDSLDLLAPVSDSKYQSLRPTLKQPQSSNPLDVFTEDTRLQWHPNASPIRDLHRAGKVTVMPGIGYGTDQMSHFVSRHYWEVGELNDQAQLGWLGRYLDAHGTPDNPLQGLSLDTFLSPVLAPASAPVATIQTPQNYWVGVRNVQIPAMLNGTFEAAQQLAQITNGCDPAISQANEAMSAMMGVDADLVPIQGETPSPAGGAQYPAGSFANSLAILADMIDQGLPLRCVTIQGPGGYDTHASQTGILPNNLDVLSKSLSAFQADIEGRGIDDRVVVHVWSEFGRRAYDNGSGTDHGAAGASLLIGTSVTGQMVGEFPGVASLDQYGNLLTTVDYRAVYCSLLEQWFGVDSTGIITNASHFPRPTLIKST
jgi:uncharacterized protein (DUF1501 family)